MKTDLVYAILDPEGNVRLLHPCNTAKCQEDNQFAAWTKFFYYTEPKPLMHGIVDVAIDAYQSIGYRVERFRLVACEPTGSKG